MDSQKRLAIIGAVLGILAVVIFAVYFMKTMNPISAQEADKVVKPITLPPPGDRASTTLPQPEGGTNTPAMPMGGGPTGAPVAPPR